MVLHPLETNEKTGEPFLRLATPFAHIIVTPPRLSDRDSVFSAMNDPRVYSWITGPPNPYLYEDADWWLKNTKEDSDNVMKELEAGGELVSGCPVRILREVKEDGSEIYLGDVRLDKFGWPHVDKESRERQVEENCSKELGDPSIIWEFGDYLVPSHHGKGIMTAVIQAVLHKWAIPRMNVRHICLTTFAGNVGSRRVFEKNGFKFTQTVKDCAQTRGRVYSLDIFEWHL